MPQRQRNSLFHWRFSCIQVHSSFFSSSCSPVPKVSICQVTMQHASIIEVLLDLPMKNFDLFQVCRRSPLKTFIIRCLNSSQGLLASKTLTTASRQLALFYLGYQKIHRKSILWGVHMVVFFHCIQLPKYALLSFCLCVHSLIVNYQASDLIRAVSTRNPVTNLLSNLASSDIPDWNLYEGAKLTFPLESSFHVRWDGKNAQKGLIVEFLVSLFQHQ